MNTKLLLAPALVASSLGLGACAQNYAVEGAEALHARVGRGDKQNFRPPRLQVLHKLVFYAGV